MNKVIIEADGGSRGNPGPAGSGCLLIDAQTNDILAEAAIFIGVSTNNVAEYQAVLTGIQLANELAQESELLIRMDSKLVIEQLSGNWKVKHENMVDMFQQVITALGKRKVSFEWIPREQNSRADKLANQAMDAEISEIRKYSGKQSDSAIDVKTVSSEVTATNLEYNPVLPSSVRAPRNVTKKLTTLILIRHGRTAFTESHRLSGRDGEDPALSEVGHEDATKVAKVIAEIGSSGQFKNILRPSRIISSPLTRAQETAGLIAKATGLAIEIEPGIAEISFGDWDGYTNAEVAEQFSTEFEAWRGSVEISPPGGESLKDFEARVIQAKDSILTKYEGETLVLVSHVMPIRGLVRSALDSDWQAYWRVSVAPCSITILRFWGDEAAELTCVNYSGHL
ncbi:MAG: hypothetical protein RIQ88_583 [Actinomycetota bacterium]